MDKIKKAHLDEMKNFMLSKNFKILTPLVNKQTKVHYLCICGNERKQLFRDLKRRNCRKCEEKKFRVNDRKDYKDGDEQWKAIDGGWISNKGRAKNALGRLLTLCKHKFRYRINFKHQYASRLVAINFKINNYEKLLEDNQSWCVSHKDKNKTNNNINNLYIRSKKDIGKENGKKSNKTQHKEFNKDDFKNIKSKKIKELHNYHILYENGEIWNGQKFLKFSKNGKYLALFLKDPIRTYKVHRLICYAFNPIEGKTCLKDYKELQVNHKNGITTDNNASNLEWNTQSENMKHAYNNKLNRKTRYVIQYDKKTNIIIKEYISISEASRNSKESEYIIRKICKGGTSKTNKFIWKYKNPKESKEYTKKYSKQ